ncbi:Crp/Fnr family transcriptional regulator [Listeria costaricensis]|uniref:Crp/Fnr family transcriptional regulator n=1 Tax=Listeria costaricensis TaxID=2026604 RepID=UPI000C077C78|nr:Crp/Fnr family transcriptional regulator [Listeria costaricensis]
MIQMEMELLNFKKEAQLDQQNYFICEGIVSLEYQGRIIRILQKGDFILSTWSKTIFDQLVFRAKTECLLMEVGEDEISTEQLEEEKEKLLQGFMDRTDLIIEKDAEKRYLLFLSYLGREIGTTINQKVIIPKIFKYQELAQTLELTREYLSAIEKKMIESHKLEKEKGVIMIQAINQL